MACNCCSAEYKDEDTCLKCCVGHQIFSCGHQNCSCCTGCCSKGYKTCELTSCISCAECSGPRCCRIRACTTCSARACTSCSCAQGIFTCTCCNSCLCEVQIGACRTRSCLECGFCTFCGECKKFETCSGVCSPSKIFNENYSCCDKGLSNVCRCLGPHTQFQSCKCSNYRLCGDNPCSAFSAACIVSSIVGCILILLDLLVWIVLLGPLRAIAIPCTWVGNRWHQTYPQVRFPLAHLFGQHHFLFCPAVNILTNYKRCNAAGGGDRR